MKKLSIFETSIIGLLVGALVSTYISFLNGTEAYVGKILNLISLKPLSQIFFEKINLTEYQIFYAFFVFVILVFIIYGVIFGLILNKLNRGRLLIIPLVLLGIGAFFEQTSERAKMTIKTSEIPYVASAIKATPKKVLQYFGTEALGDLDGDGTDDVAFITSRNFKDGNIAYYLCAAITSDKGKTGTNQIYIGEKIQGQEVTVENSVINVKYSNENSTTTENFYAQIIDGNLEETKSHQTSTSTDPT